MDQVTSGQQETVANNCPVGQSKCIGREYIVKNLWIILNLDFNLKQIIWMFIRINTNIRWIQLIAIREIMGSPLDFVIQPIATREIMGSPLDFIGALMISAR
jgi:hypothetical protein